MIIPASFGVPFLNSPTVLNLTFWCWITSEVYFSVSYKNYFDKQQFKIFVSNDIVFSLYIVYVTTGLTMLAMAKVGRTNAQVLELNALYSYLETIWPIR